MNSISSTVNLSQFRVPLVVAIDNVSVSVATALVRAVREAGMVVIRDERDRSIHAVDPALVARLRQAVPA